MPNQLKQSVGEFVQSVRESEELKSARPEVRHQVGKVLTKLEDITFEPDGATDTNPVISTIDNILCFIEGRLREIREKTEPEIADIKKMAAEASSVKLDLTETKELMDKLEASCMHTIETLKDFGYEDFKNTHKLSVWQNVLVKTLWLNPEVIWRISRFVKPEVLVIPQERLTERFKRLDGNKKMANQSYTSFTEAAAKHWEKHNRIYTYSITDGAECMPKNQYGLSNALGVFKIGLLKEKLGGQGMRMMNPDEYAILTMKAIRDGNPIDRNASGIIGPKTFLPLNHDNPLQMEIGPVFGFWHENTHNGDCRMVFMAIDTSDAKNAIRVRPVVDL